MEAGGQQFTKFISGEVTLIIPVYQRNYDWKTENCKRLFEDMIHIVDSKKPHFIGTFVYQFDTVSGGAQEYTIIDGQQRITSIILLAKAIYDLTDDKDLKSDIRSKFIKHITGKNLKGKCRLQPNEFDRVTFEELMSDNGFDENKLDKNSVMYGNYRFFREEISKWAYTQQKLEELCEAISQLNVVSIAINQENPQEIFESINSTGLALSQADLIRNFLLMSLDYHSQEELYKNYWLEIEDLLRPSNNVENFIVQYLITQRKSNAITEGKRQVSNKNLYEVFKIFFTNNYTDDNTKKIEECLQELLRYAHLFKRCIFNESDDFNELNPLDKKFYELTFILKSDNSPIVLMYLLDRYEKKDFDESTFIKFLDALISLVFRAKVCKCTGIDQQFAGNFLARLDKEKSLDEDSFWQAITFGSGNRTFPNDNDFKEALAGNNLQDRIKETGFKYFLYSLERQEDTQNLLAYSDTSVEQVLPKKPNKTWKKYLEAHKDSDTYEPWIQTLGNQTLVNHSEKGRNDIFDKKKIRYAQSNFSYTRNLNNEKEWTSRRIQKRTKELSDKAIEIWILPSKYNSSSSSVGKTFNLDSDFSEFKGKKPHIISICDDNKEIKNWNTLLREIVTELYNLDPFIVQKVALTEFPLKGKFSANKNDLNKPHKIGKGDFYMELNLSTENCLKVAKTLVENFDRSSGTNFKEEIYFTLR